MSEQLPVMAWVAIGIFVAGLIFGALRWLWNRWIGRLDMLEAAVFGDDGVKHRLHKFVTSDVLETKLRVMGAQMQGISEEGQKREERILAAISNQTLVLGSEIGEIKEDARAQARRTDDVMKMFVRSIP